MPAKRDLTAYLRTQSSTGAGEQNETSDQPAATELSARGEASGVNSGQTSSQSEPVHASQDSRSKTAGLGSSRETSPHRRKGATPRRMRRQDFVLTEAEREKGSVSPEETEEDSEENDSDHVEEEDSQVEDSPGFHRRVDGMHQGSGTDFVAPYFPTALAVSKECPLAFNFDLRLLDCLRLPCELVARTEMAMIPSGEAASREVNFKSREEAVAYCQDRLKQGWLVGKDNRRPSKRLRLSHPELQKEQLFKREGRSLEKVLASGIPGLDLSLDKVRLDRFDNVMLWNAPEWSPASVQFTHGFPRRLIEAEHGGFLPGNIVVTAKATNLSIRRMSIMDVASLLSRQCIAGSGLSLARLLNLRYAAVRYHSSDSYLPDYLVRGTLDFGVNFLTFQAVQSDTLDALSRCLKEPWACQSEGQGEGEEEDFAASEVTLSVDLLRSIGHRAMPVEQTEVTAVTEQRERALNRILSNSVAEADTEAEAASGTQESPATNSTEVSSQATRKRKRKGSSSAGSRPVKNKKATPKTPETVASDEDSTTSEEQEATAPTTAQTRSRDLQLDTCPVRGLRRDVFPEGEARRKLFQFLGQHQPSDPQVVERKAGGNAIWTNPGDICQHAVVSAAESTGEVQRLLRDLFAKLRHHCVCQEGNCSLRSDAQTLSGDPAPACQSPRRCQVCLAFEAQPRELYGKCLSTKNERLNLLLCCCPAIAKICRLSKAPTTLSADESQKHDLDVRNLLRALVKCGENRLNCMRNIGDLAEITPRLLCVQLRTGHSEFWNHLRTVAKVVNKQPNLEAKLAALIALRKLVPPGNHWSFYLASTDENAGTELDILKRWTEAASKSGSTADSSSSSRPLQADN